MKFLIRYTETYEKVIDAEDQAEAEEIAEQGLDAVGTDFLTYNDCSVDVIPINPEAD